MYPPLATSKARGGGGYAPRTKEQMQARERYVQTEDCRAESGRGVLYTDRRLQRGHTLGRVNTKDCGADPS